jgi:hypothetical protein
VNPGDPIHWGLHKEYPVTVCCRGSLPLERLDHVEKVNKYTSVGDGDNERVTTIPKELFDDFDPPNEAYWRAPEEHRWEYGSYRHFVTTKDVYKHRLTYIMAFPTFLEVLEWVGYIDDAADYEAYDEDGGRGLVADGGRKLDTEDDLKPLPYERLSEDGLFWVGGQSEGPISFLGMVENLTGVPYRPVLYDSFLLPHQLVGVDSVHLFSRKLGQYYHSVTRIDPGDLFEWEDSGSFWLLPYHLIGEGEYQVLIKDSDTAFQGLHTDSPGMTQEWGSPDVDDWVLLPHEMISDQGFVLMNKDGTSNFRCEYVYNKRQVRYRWGREATEQTDIVE